MQGKCDIIVNVKPIRQAVRHNTLTVVCVSSILTWAVSGEKYDRANIIIGNAY